MNAVRAGAVVALGALTWGGCTPDFAENGSSQAVLLVTGVNSGDPLESDVRISTGEACADFVPVHVENHFKNPGVTDTGFRNDLIIERYEIHYLRSDGRGVEGVDVPYSLTGNLSQFVREDSEQDFTIEAVRRQAKLEPPVANLRNDDTLDGQVPRGGGALALTVFAEITLHARTATGNASNVAVGRLQIDFANIEDADVFCAEP